LAPSITLFIYGTTATDAYAYKIILDNLSFSDSDKDT
jgi:hypothetical protein